MIPIRIPIEEDELFVSWAHTMACMNGMSDADFSSIYFEERIPTEGFRTDIVKNLEEICRMHSENGDIPKLEEIVCRHTVWPLLLPFLTYPAQAKRLEFMLRSTASSVSALTGYVWADSRQYRFCPECMKADMEKTGRPVIHVPHQVPGVTCCAKHGIRLAGMDSLDEIPDIQIQKADSSEIGTARFFEDMYKDPMLISWKETAEVIRRKLSAVGKGVMDVLTDVKDLYGISEEEIRTSTVFQNYGEHTVAKSLPVLLTLLFPTYHDFVRETGEESALDLEKDVTEKMKDQYDIIGRFGSVIRLKCRTCGNEFHTHPWSAAHGGLCPDCQKGKFEEDILEEMLLRIGGGKLELVRRNPDRKITVRCSACGAVRTEYPSALVWREIPCPQCEEIRKKAEWDRTGETRLQNNGLMATVSDYRRHSDIDVLFSDGTLVRNRRYGEFLKGNIGNRVYDINRRLSLRVRAENGQMMRILEYHGCDNIDVVFEDGTIVRNKDFERFEKGRITNPNYKRPDRVGETATAGNGQEMKIIAYRNSRDIDARFEDGTVIRHVTYDNFQAGRICNPNVGKKGTYASDRIGETARAGNGQMMKIIAYRGSNDIDVMFEDGTVVEHRIYHAFRNGQIANPKDKKKGSRVGETATANNGQVMKIVEYRNNLDIDVLFPDGTVVRHKTYRNFLAGKIANPKTAVHYDRVGETVTANCGMKMTIIAYRTSSDLDIRFEDGTVVEHRSYRDFRKGAVRHP